MEAGGELLASKGKGELQKQCRKTIAHVVRRT